ncbi:hypothetical protein J7E71_08015 [Mesobacillus foraminis]|uniref:hypothetical protein n=1 Tax=Mesobacillus foraminis TaxID=279826 RepID=UPI001BE5F913|nr:hypothetical protein [Mesobacillus foraminis]MBT2755891.1 hypothetical protein [Mesobacillus foraminis]
MIIISLSQQDNIETQILRYGFNQEVYLVPFGIQTISISKDSEGEGLYKVYALNQDGNALDDVAGSWEYCLNYARIIAKAANISTKHIVIQSLSLKELDNIKKVTSQKSKKN